MTDTLLPTPASDLEIALDDTTGRRIDGLPVPVDTLWDSQSCPDQVLPWLGWAVRTVPWISSWTTPIQRQAIAASIPTHRRRGTPAAVRQALAAGGYTATITEWWQLVPAGQPYTFGVTVQGNSSLVGPDGNREIREIIYHSKSLRSHLAWVCARYDLSSSLRIGTACKIAGSIRCTAIPDPPSASLPARMAAVSTLRVANVIRAVAQPSLPPWPIIPGIAARIRVAAAVRTSGRLAPAPMQIPLSAVPAISARAAHRINIGTLYTLHGVPPEECYL